MITMKAIKWAGTEQSWLSCVVVPAVPEIMMIFLIFIHASCKIKL